MVIAIGEVTGVSDDTISVFTILGNDVDIALREADQAGEASVGGWAVVMAERSADGLVARWVRPCRHRMRTLTARGRGPRSRASRSRK